MAEATARKRTGDGDLVILNGNETLSLLEHQELKIVEVVQKAYETHAGGDSMLPHSTFLRFPGNDANRIIALPAYLGDGLEMAGMKWIASFPGNLQKGMERASAVVVLNSTDTGRPRAIIEGSLISAKRTAASAALAARILHDGPASRVGVIGCGLISYETVRFLRATVPGIQSYLIFDKNLEQSQLFKSRLGEVDIAPDAETVLRECPITVLATTAGVPHIFNLPAAPFRRTILHVSLRDFAPEVILACDNVVDDVDHVCRAQTSLHLAEQLAGHRDFIRCGIGDLLLGRAAARSDTHDTTIFSPFGLGILDIAVAAYVLEQGLQKGLGTVVESFYPSGWTERTETRISLPS